MSNNGIIRRAFRWPPFYTTMAPTARDALSADNAAFFAVGHHLATGRREPDDPAIPILVLRFSTVWVVLSAEIVAALLWVVLR